MHIGRDDATLLLRETLKFPVRVAIVVSCFNEEVTDKLYEGAIQRLRERNILPKAIDVVWVPGAIEIPLAAQRLARSARYTAIICLGAVICGETDHYNYVCQQVSGGCQRVSLEHDLPVVFGVLTTNNKLQALARAGGAHGHKG